MDIVFVNNSNSLNGLLIKNYSSNPGIGGTEYVTIKIIYGIKRISKKFNVSLATNQKVLSNSINIIPKKGQIINSIIVLPVHQIKYLNSLKIKNCRIILWSHHPHDTIDYTQHNFKEVVSLGEYQYISNKNISTKKFVIPNPFPKPVPEEKLTRFKNLAPRNFVFIGAIGPAKGLHLVLEIWPKVRKKFKNCSLKVIGGNLYKQKKNRISKILSFNSSYEKVIENKLKKMSREDRDSISFLGLLSRSDKDKVLKNSDVALLNPTGKSEAAPASPLECYCYGIPVIAAGDFGAFDNMKNFPELDLKINSIEKILNFLIKEENFGLIKKRAYFLAKEKFKENKSIYNNWIKLFNNKLEEPDINLPLVIYKKIFIREIYYRFIKYPLKRLKNLIFLSILNKINFTN